MNIISAGSLIGGMLAADFKCLEFRRIFTPSIGFIIFLINAKALYKGYIKILYII